MTESTPPLTPEQAAERIRQLEVSLDISAKQQAVLQEAAAQAAQTPAAAPGAPASWIQQHPATAAIQAWSRSGGIGPMGLTGRSR